MKISNMPLVALAILGIFDYKSVLDIQKNRSVLVSDLGVPADSLKNLKYKDSYIPFLYLKDNSDTAKTLNRAVDSVKIAQRYPTWNAERVSREVRTLWR